MWGWLQKLQPNLAPFPELLLNLQFCKEVSFFLNVSHKFTKSIQLYSIHFIVNHFIPLLTTQSLFIFQSSAKQLAESVDLLLQLKEPPDELCDEFLAQ